MWSAQSFGDRQYGESTQAANLGVLVMGAVMVILQAVSTPFGSNSDLTAVGILAVVLSWLMWRVEKRLDENRATIDKLVRAILILSLSRDEDDRGAAHQEATKLLKDYKQDIP